MSPSLKTLDHCPWVKYIGFAFFLRKTMDDPNFAKRKIVYVCDPHPHKRANAAVNIGAFAVFYLEKSPDEAFEPLGRLRPAYHPFRDAGYGVCRTMPCSCCLVITLQPNVYQITVLDVLRGLFRGKREGWIDLETFDLQEYEVCLFKFCLGSTYLFHS
mmetsp:Transcript_6098/g.14968  ORF Transcript_6098/g.14968 Transcript_6098/m.14968 type:complete len:158 (+) Transcript_6098:191-664(+)